MSALDSSLLARQAIVVDAARLFLLLGVPDARLDVIVRTPGDTANAIARNENILFEIDAAMPMSWFRERFARIGDKRLESELSSEALSRTANLLARRARDVARIDRIEFIATRLLTRELPDGQLEALPEGEFFQLLSQLSLGVTADDDTRDKAVAFCVSAAERLQQATSVETLLGSGVYLELQGYKKSLREKRLDAAILYACILLSVAITNYLIRFAAGEGLAHRTLLARVASTELDAEKILSAAEDTDADKLKPHFARSARLRDDPRLRLVVGIVIAFSIWTFGGPPHPTAVMSDLPPDRFGPISPVLQSALLSDGEAPRVFIARVVDKTWARLSPEEKRSEAVAVRIARGVQQEEASLGLIYDGDKLVALIEEGTLTWLDP
jgi:hypothetical protein